MKTKTLRDYQTRDASRISRALREFRRVLYVLPTGGGKTVLASHLIEQWRRAGKRVLVLVHRQELLQQMYTTLVDGMGVDAELVGVIWQHDRRENLDAAIQVASIDTLIRRNKPAADVVVLDEAHHAVSNKWRGVLAWYPESLIIGLTATPMRLDGKPLRDAFDEMVVGPTVQELIDAGWLMRPRCFVRPGGRSIELKGLRTIAGDWDRGELSRRSNSRVLIGDIVAHILEHAKKKTGIVFAVDVKHALSIHRRLEAAGIRSAVVTGQTPHGERRKLLAPGGLLDRGKVQVVVSCDVLTEGYDLPSVSVAILARKTKSEALYLHMVGRVLRTDKGKPLPVVLDHAGNVTTHGMPQGKREWSLTGTRRGGKAKQPPKAKACAECGALNILGAVKCGECGVEFPMRAMPVETGAHLREVEPPSEEEVRAFFEKRRTEILARAQKIERLSETERTKIAVGGALAACEIMFGRKPKAA